MLIGKSYHQIDEKGRIRIPNKFKTELGNERLIIMQAPNNILKVYPESLATKMFDSLAENVDFTDEEAMNAQSYLAGIAEYADEDKQGRTTLSQDQIAYAKLKKDIVIKGAYNHLEIWDKDLFEETAKNADIHKYLSTLNQRQGSAK